MSRSAVAIFAVIFLLMAGLYNNCGTATFGTNGRLASEGGGPGTGSGGGNPMVPLSIRAFSPYREHIGCLAEVKYWPNPNATEAQKRIFVLNKFPFYMNGNGGVNPPVPIATGTEIEAVELVFKPGCTTGIASLLSYEAINNPNGTVSTNLDISFRFRGLISPTLPRTGTIELDVRPYMQALDSATGGADMQTLTAPVFSTFTYIP